MDLNQAIQEIRKGQPRPVYVVYGQDRYRMQHLVELMRKTLLADEEQELGIVRFDTAEASLEEIILEAETVPFFAARKLILVRDQTLLAAGGKESGKVKHEPEQLLAYLAAPLDTSVLVFIVHADKLDERRKLVKQLKGKDALVPCQPLGGSDLLRWIVRRAAEQKRQLHEQTAELIMRRCGSNLYTVAHEVDKLCLYVGDGGTVTKEHVELLTPPSVEEDVFALVDAMSAREPATALRIYRALLLRKEEPIRIAALLARQLRIMLQLKELESQGTGQQQMASQLGLHPYAVKLAAEKARRFTMQELGTLLARMAELDFYMKTGQVDKALGVELFLLQAGPAVLRSTRAT